MEGGPGVETVTPIVKLYSEPSQFVLYRFGVVYDWTFRPRDSYI